MAVKGSAIRAVITGGAGRKPVRDPQAGAQPRGVAASLAALQAERLAVSLDADREAARAAAPHVADQGDPDEGFIDELKPGTQLFHGQYTVIGFLNSGGFGITYLAKDSLDRTVVIKECFPGSLCRRSNTIVRARSRAHQSDFRSVVRLFVQEARNLSKLIHPNIVGVHQVFEDNDTAYMAIDYIRGRDLLDLLEDPAHRFVPMRVVGYVRKMLEAVRFVHESGVLHRDISPDNILIGEDDEPVLIDFGAAREQASKQTRALSTLRVVKDGYSPQEFYIAGSVQNESSDLYALAATFYHVISGEVPVDSQRRLSSLAETGEDPYVPLAGRIPGYPPGFLEALDRAASVLPKDRLKTADDWLLLLEDAGRVAALEIDSARVAEIESAVAQLVATPGPAGVEAPAGTAGTRERPAKAAPGATAARLFPRLADPQPASDEARSRLRRAAVPLALAGSAAAAAVAAAVAVYLWIGGPVAAPRAEAPVADVTAVMPPVAAAADGLAARPTSASAAATLSVPAPVPLLAEGSGSAAVAARVSRGEATPVPVAVPALLRVAGLATAVGESGVRAMAAVVAEVPPRARLAAPPAARSRAQVAAAASASGTAEARRLAAAATGLTYDPPPAARDPAVLADQIAAAAWTGFVLPFETRTVRIGGDDFPQVSSVLPEAGLAEGNGWLRPGVTIYAVDNAWVSDEASIRAQMDAAAARGGPVVLELRVREALDRPFEVVRLAVPGAREARFAGGLTVGTAPDGAGWRATVLDPGALAPAGRALEAGDVIRAEAVTGRGIDGATAIEEIVAALAAGGFAEGRLTVLRDGAETQAALVLARAE